MASNRFPHSLFSRKRNRSNAMRTRSAHRVSVVERLEDRQLLAVVGFPADQLATSADGYVDRIYSDWIAHQASGSTSSFASTQPSFYQISGDTIAVKVFAPANTAEVASTLELWA